MCHCVLSHVCPLGSAALGGVQGIQWPAGQRGHGSVATVIWGKETVLHQVVCLPVRGALPALQRQGYPHIGRLG